MPLSAHKTPLLSTQSWTELRAIIRLALPVALSQLAIIGMGTTDVVLAGRAGTEELAGLSVGNNVWNGIILFFFGIGSMTQALVARHFGANDGKAIKEQIHQSIWLTFGIGLVGTAAILLSAVYIVALDFDLAIAVRAQDYLYAIAWAALPMTMMPAFRGSLEAMNRTRAVLWINLTAFLLNIPLDYALINGAWGAPQLGAEGCAWASAFLLWMSLLANAGLLIFHPKVKALKIFAGFNKPNLTIMSKTFWLGLPVGLSVMIELSMFAGAGLLIAKLGMIDVGAHSIALSIASTSFMVYLGLAQGISIRAAQFLGAGMPKSAAYTVRIGMIWSLLFALLLSLVLLFNRPFLVSLYTSDALVTVLAVDLLIFAAVFQLADCLQAVAIAALRSYHETRTPPFYMVFAFWILGLPLGIWLGFYSPWPLLAGANGFWLAMVVSLVVAGGLMMMKLRSVIRVSLAAN